VSRRSQRFRARFAANVHVVGRPTALVCHTRDISADGCLFDTGEPLAIGTAVAFSLFDNDRGEALEVEGVVVRAIATAEGQPCGLGVHLPSPPPEWEALVDRYEQGRSGETVPPGLRLTVLVVGDEPQRRGAVALYVTSGWDVSFASDPATAQEALTASRLDAVIAEYEPGDPRGRDVLAAAHRLQPSARRVLRTGDAGPTPDEVVQRVIARDGGIDELLAALLEGDA
jgi:hypothetical protein